MTNLLKSKQGGGKAKRIMVLGEPGHGKTGGLACLANAGYKLRILDYDGNLDPLYSYCTDEGLGNIDAVYLRDKVRIDASGLIQPVGVPTAYRDGLKLLDQWKYTDKDGTEVDLGASKEWGLDTIVVVDSLTRLGEACMLRARAMANKTILNQTHRVWGFAADDQNEFVKKLTSDYNNHHVIVLAHMKMIGPREEGEKDSDSVKDIKKQQAELISTRYFPRAVGRELPQHIASHFPTVVKVEPVYTRTGSARRVIRSVPLPELDLKVPASNLPNDLDIADGMLRIFEALGSKPPTKGESA